MNSKEALHHLFTEYQLSNRGINSFEAFFNHYTIHNHRLWDRYTKGFVKQEELKWKRMWLTLLEYKIADEPLSKKLAVDFLEILPTKKNIFPHTYEILDYLKSKNYQLHLITNGFEKVQHHKLTNSNLKPYFKEVITSEASNSIKPQKEIFDYAMQKAKASSKESIMIGDNLEADIVGGKNAGLDTVFVNHINATPHIKATYEIKHLQELENIF